jgi:hypothetical protein
MTDCKCHTMRRNHDRRGGEGTGVPCCGNDTAATSGESRFVPLNTKRSRSGVNKATSSSSSVAVVVVVGKDSLFVSWPCPMTTNSSAGHMRCVGGQTRLLPVRVQWDPAFLPSGLDGSYHTLGSSGIQCLAYTVASSSKLRRTIIRSTTESAPGCRGTSRTATGSSSRASAGRPATWARRRRPP